MVAWIALLVDDSSCGFCRVVHRLASCMVGMIQKFMSMKFIEVFPVSTVIFSSLS